jgi:hypothetical protein
MSCEREPSVAFRSISHGTSWGPLAAVDFTADLLPSPSSLLTLFFIPCRVCARPSVRRNGSYPSRTAVTGRPTHIVTILYSGLLLHPIPPPVRAVSPFLTCMCTRRWRRHTPSSTVWCFDAVTHPVRSTHTNEKKRNEKDWQTNENEWNFFLKNIIIIYLFCGNETDGIDDLIIF